MCEIKNFFEENKLTSLIKVVQLMIPFFDNALSSLFMHITKINTIEAYNTIKYNGPNHLPIAIAIASIGNVANRSAMPPLRTKPFNI